MKSLILAVTGRYLLPVLLLFSIFLLARGHDAPGGGFAAGLVAASAVALHGIAYGFPELRELPGMHPRMFIAIGLALAIGSGLAGRLVGEPFLSGLWITLPIPGTGRWSVGTPLLFDLGVYLVVTGVAATLLLELAEE